jgi:hypothetical protein
MAGKKQAQNRGAQSQQAHETKTFSDGHGHCKYDPQVLAQLHGGGIEPSRLAMGGVHDITNSRHIDCSGVTWASRLGLIEEVE